MLFPNVIFQHLSNIKLMFPEQNNIKSKEKLVGAAEWQHNVKKADDNAKKIASHMTLF